MTENRWIYKVSASLLAVLCSLALVLGGCSSSQPSSSSGGAADEAQKNGLLQDSKDGVGTYAGSQQAASLPATIEALADQLYTDVDNVGVAELDETLLLERFGVDASLSPHWVARYAAKESYGVADFFIFQLPEDAENRNLLYQQLTAVQQERERYFENLDVFGSHDIAKSAQVTQAGDYMYLCMLPDQEAKLEQIQAFLAAQS